MSETPSRSALVIGESIIDIVESVGEPVSHVGGSPLNVAVGLSRLGIPTTFATEIGDDDNGRMIRDYLDAANVEVVLTASANRSTSTARARIGADGSATYDFAVRWAVDHPPSSRDYSVVHVGSIGALMQPGAARVLEVVERLPTRTLVTFDPNIRPALLPPRAEVLPLVERYASRANIVKLSDEDADWLYAQDAADAARRLLAQGTKVVVVTHGSEGSVVHTSLGQWPIPPFPTVVADTIGAGDAYMAGLIASVVHRKSIAAAITGRLGEAELMRIGRIAAVAAGLTVGQVGATPPDERELMTASRSEHW